MTNKNKCKHKGYLDYCWVRHDLDPRRDYIEAIFCHTCGYRIK